MPVESWALQGEVVRSCNCAVFCPAALSLGQHVPPEGACLSWLGMRIDAGHFDDVDLSGLNLGLMLEAPGPVARGNWTVALFVDKHASIYAIKAFGKIFSGKADGPAALFSALTGRFLGIELAPIAYETEGRTRIFCIEEVVDGAVTPVAGRHKDRDTVISNSRYWIAPDIIVASADKSRFTAFGRDWDFAGRSAEICKLDWRGP